MFDNIIGHNIQKEVLENVITSNNVFHAYLFSGQKGIGKSSLAREFAKKLLNTNNLETCPDYKYIFKDAEKKDISVEQIRKNIIDDVYILPVAGDRKVYIIDDGENLNKASQNALLKTLEEPPKYITIIIISSGVSNFLPTITSRVSEISFNKIDDDLLEKYIKEKYDTLLEKNIIKFFNGSLGLAVEFISKNEIDKIKEVDKLYNYILNKNVVDAFQIIQNIDFSNEHILDYFEYIFFSMEKYQIIKYVEKARSRLKYNGNYDIVIDNMLLKIIDNI